MRRVLIWILILAGSVYMMDPDTARYMIWCGFLLMTVMLEDRR